MGHAASLRVHPHSEDDKSRKKLTINDNMGHPASLGHPGDDECKKQLISDNDNMGHAASFRVHPDDQSRNQPQKIISVDTSAAALPLRVRTRRSTEIFEKDFQIKQKKRRKSPLHKLAIQKEAEEFDPEARKKRRNKLAIQKAAAEFNARFAVLEPGTRLRLPLSLGRSTTRRRVKSSFLDEAESAHKSAQEKISADTELSMLQRRRSSDISEETVRSCSFSYRG